jgi:hypothetical protein
LFYKSLNLPPQTLNVTQNDLAQVAHHVGCVTQLNA